MKPVYLHLLTFMAGSLATLPTAKLFFSRSPDGEVPVTTQSEVEHATYSGKAYRPAKPVDRPFSTPVERSPSHGLLRLERRNAALELVALAAQDPSAALAAYRKLPKHERNGWLVQSIYERWAAVDPEAAFKSARTEDVLLGNDCYGVYGAVLATWAAQDPDAMLFALEPLKEDETGDYEMLLSCMMSDCVQHDPETAKALISRIPDGDARTEGLRDLVRVLAEQQPEYAFSWIDQYATVGERKNLRMIALQTMAQSRPEQAASWIDRMAAGPEKQAMISLLAGTWGHQDTGAAFEWLATIDAGPAREEAYRILMSNYMEQEPMDAAAIVLELADGSLKQELAPQVASAFAREDPESALVWAQMLPAVTQEWALENVLQSWVAQDAYAAMEAARRLGNRATKTTFTHCVEIESETARDLLPTLPDEAVNASSVRRLSAQLAEGDPQQTEAWVDTLPNADWRNHAIAGLADRQLSNGQPEEAWAQAEKISGDPDLQLKLMRECMADWSRTDTQAAFDRLQRSYELTFSEKERLLLLFPEETRLIIP